MTSTKYGLGQLICGTGGALLIVSLFLPWAGAVDVDMSGWELWTMADVFFVIVGLVAIGTALTGGRFGLFRPDLSLGGAADLLGVVATSCSPGSSSSTSPRAPVARSASSWR